MRKSISSLTNLPNGWRLNDIPKTIKKFDDSISDSYVESEEKLGKCYILMCLKIL